MKVSNQIIRQPFKDEIKMNVFPLSQVEIFCVAEAEKKIN
jgi:hypothetical protein